MTETSLVPFKSVIPFRYLIRGSGRTDGRDDGSKVEFELENTKFTYIVMRLHFTSHPLTPSIFACANSLLEYILKLTILRRS